MSADDPDLLRRAGRGDAHAFHALIEKHGDYLFGIAKALVRDAHFAEDLVQETLLATMKSGSKFRGDSSVRTWLVKVLVRQASMMRRTRWHRDRPLSLSVSDDAAQTPAAVAPGGEDPGWKLDLATMLESLSVDHRQVVVLRELEGLSYEQIAEALSLPRGTVESRLHRAREHLKTKFSGYFADDEARK